MSQIMEIKFNREKDERKALVKAIGEILGCEPVYMRAPSLAYVVGDCTVDRYGTLSFGEGADASEIQRLLAELTARGYVGEGVTDLVTPCEPAIIGDSEENAIIDAADDTEVSTDDEVVVIAIEVATSEVIDVESVASMPSNDETAVVADKDTSTSAVESADTSLCNLRSVVDEHGLNLTIHVPFVGFSTTALENLDRLVSGKSWLIMKALGADALPINRTTDTISFPWFPVISSHLEVDAYARFIHALCEMSKKQKRVTLKEKPIDPNASEKFAFRCFLLRLGFIGKEYTSARKILLSKLSGNGSFKAGDSNKRKVTAEVRTVDDAEEVPAVVAVEVVTDESVDVVQSTDNVMVTPRPLRCKECHHHCYYTDGEMHTSTGELVDTSKRTPGKHTHYCLGVPSGYRKLKHAVDWSGGETPPKWCPLAVQNSDSVSADSSTNGSVSALGLEVAM